MSNNKIKPKISIDGGYKQEIPNNCPLVDTCKQYLTYEEYDYGCCNNGWVFCNYANSAAKKYKKKPKEWVKYRIAEEL